MDYEFRIKQAELELKYLRDMQDLSRSRLNTHDRSIEAIDTILDRITATVERTAANLDLLTIEQGKLEAKMDRLVDALLHGRAQDGGTSG